MIVDYKCYVRCDYTTEPLFILSLVEFQSQSITMWYVVEFDDNAKENKTVEIIPHSWYDEKRKEI